MQKINKLFRAYSFLDDLFYEDREPGYLYHNDNVLVHWFYDDIEWGDVNYSKIIKGYKKLPVNFKELAEEYVNELFTEDEIEMLRHFLAKEHNLKLLVEEVVFPFEVELEDGVWLDVITEHFIDAPKIGLDPWITVKNSGDRGIPFRVSGHKDYFKTEKEKSLFSCDLFGDSDRLMDALGRY